MANTVPYKPRVWPTDPKDAHLQNTQEFQRISNALQDINNQLGSGGGGGGTSFPTSTVPWAIQGGTANAMTASYPTITTLADGQLVGLRKVGTNSTGAVTLAINGGTAHTVVLNTFGPSNIVGTFIDAAEMLLRWNAGANEWICVNEPFTGVQEAGGPGQSGGNKLFLGWTAASHASLVVDVTNVGNIVTDNATFSASLMPAVQKMMFPSMPELAGGNANVVNQGADPTGVTDATTIIQNTMNSYGIAYLPKGLYKVSSTLVFPHPGSLPTSASAVGLIGEGWANTIIQSTNTTTDVIQFFQNTGSGGNYGCVLKGMTITRSSLATTGYGINTAPNDATNTYDHAILEELYVSNNSIGVHLGGANTGWSHASRVHSESNRLDGFEIHGTWQLYDLYSTLNGRDGFRVDATNSASSGQWRGLSTFNNQAVGFHVVGTAGAIQAIRLSDSFFGADGAQEMVIDSFGAGSAHVFTNVYCESPGQSPSNPNTNCIDITGNNPDITFINCAASAGQNNIGTFSSPVLTPGSGRAFSYAGIQHLQIIGGQYLDTGTGTAIAVTGGTASIIGTRADSTSGTGIAAVAPASACSIIGCHATGGVAGIVNTVATAYTAGNF